MWKEKPESSLPTKEKFTEGESSGSNKRAAQQNMEQDYDAIESSMRGLHLYRREGDDEDTERDDPKGPSIGQHEVLLDDVLVPGVESSMRMPEEEDIEWDGRRKPIITQNIVPLDNLWAPNCGSNDVLRVRVDTLRQRLALEGITQIPNYRVFNQYIVNQNSRSLAELVEYTKNRMWLEKYTRYREICKQQWRQHGFRSKVVSRSPHITSAEARALQLWVEDIMGDFAYFINCTQDPPPEKYWSVIYRFANDIPNTRF